MRVFIMYPLEDDYEQEERKTAITEAQNRLKAIFPYCTIEMYNEVRGLYGDLWKLGQVLRALDGIDLVYFCKGWQNSKSCQLVHKVCEMYDIQRMEEKED